MQRREKEKTKQDVKERRPKRDNCGIGKNNICVFFFCIIVLGVCGTVNPSLSSCSSLGSVLLGEVLGS
jgi:hypothetical protein